MGQHVPVLEVPHGVAVGIKRRWRVPELCKGKMRPDEMHRAIGQVRNAVFFEVILFRTIIKSEGASCFQS